MAAPNDPWSSLDGGTNNAAAVAADSSHEVGFKHEPIWMTIVPAASTGASSTEAPAVAVAPDAPAVAGTAPAVAGAAPAATLFHYDLAYFEGFKAFTDGYKQHSLALKYLRQRWEIAATPDMSPPIALCDDGWITIKLVEHAKQGMDFHITNTDIWYNWHALVAQLDGDSMKYVVEGPEGRSDGLQSCWFEPRPNSYDHKRHHMMRAVGRHPPHVPKLPVWDFVMYRSDGTAVRLHPNYSNVKIEAVEVGSHEISTHPPRSGLGLSEGPGTYRSKTILARSVNLKFDAKKRPR